MVRDGWKHSRCGGLCLFTERPGLDSPGGADSRTDHPDSAPSLSQELEGEAPPRSRILQETSPQSRGCLHGWYFLC